jgi:hypothetical protein
LLLGADVDGDGQVELIVYDNADEWAGVLKWNGIGLAPVWMSPSPLVGPAGEWFRGLDRLAAVSLASGNTKGVLIYDNDDGWMGTCEWKPSGNASALEPVWMSGSPLVGPAGEWFRGIDRLVLADLDGTGITQAVIYNDGDGWTGVLAPTGNALEPVWMAPSPLGGPAGDWFRGIDRMVAADVDGDGQSEVVVYNDDDSWTGLLKWQDGALVPIWMSGSPLAGPAGDWFRGWDHIIVADVDGDGADEIVVYNNDDGWTGLLEWQDGALVPVWMSGSPLVGPAGDWYRGWDQVVVADLDDDGADEIVVYNNEDGWMGALRLLDGALVPYWMSGSPLQGIAGDWFRGFDHLVAADVDGDAQVELVVYNNDDNWTGVLKWVAVADGTATTLLTISGNGSVNTFYGQEDDVGISASTTLTNSGTTTATIERGYWAVTGPGGWLLSGLMQLVPDPNGGPGSFFGTGPAVASGASNTWELGWGEGEAFAGPFVYVLWALTATGGGGVDNLVACIPIDRTGSAPWVDWPPATPAPAAATSAVAALDLDGPVIVALQEPVDQIDDEQNSWVHVTGQLLNATGNPIQLVAATTSVLCDDGSTVSGPTPLFSIGPDMVSLVGASPTSNLVLPFHLPIDLPAGRNATTLTIEVTWQDAEGADHTVTRDASVEHPVVKLLHPPVEAAGSGFAWNFWNGVLHDQNFVGHTWSISERYAYDLTLSKPPAGTCKIAGGSQSNTDYYDYATPIYALDDGVVVMTRESAVDNHGNTDLTHLPPTDPDYSAQLPPPNIVTIRHDDGRYSVYAHVKPGSIAGAGIAVGDSVSSGQQIAELGNNDNSSEPHLHVAYWEYTPEGWERTLPMRFSNLTDTNGNSVQVTPRGFFQGIFT